MGEIIMPDIRVVSVIHDNDNDSLQISYDSDEVGGLEALGILVAGAFKHLVQVSDVDVNIDDGEEDIDDYEGDI